jgi:hypothetical protein
MLPPHYQGETSRGINKDNRKKKGDKKSIKMYVL